MTDASSARSLRQPDVNALSVVVIALAIATAGIHLYLIPAEFDKGATGYGTLFILTAVGYLVATAITYVPISALGPLHNFGRAMLVGLALAAIVAYVVLGFYDTLGWVDKAIEAALIVALVSEVAASRRTNH